MDSVDSLIGATNKFSGGLVTVTHNRDFLKRCSKNFLSIVPGAFLEFGTMKAAERATYSFITAMEEGKAIDAKQAIAQNRGGGAVHSEEYLAESAQRLNLQQAKAKAEADAIKAEEDRLAAITLAKEEKRKAKAAAAKVDWVAGDICFAPVKNSYVQVTVVRNVPAMGVTVTLESGKTMMFDAKKLKETPDAVVDVPAAKPAPKKAAAGPAPTRGGAAPRGGRGGRGRGN